MSDTARRWWDDVQHLHPDAHADAPPATGAPDLRLVEDPAPRRPRRAKAVEADLAQRARAAERAATRAAMLADAREQGGLDDAAGAAAPRALRPDATPQDATAALDDPIARPAHPEPLPHDRDERWTTDERTGRRTVAIRGQAPARATPSTAVVRRPRDGEPGATRRRTLDRTIASPDRIALWAVLLGLLLVVIAAASSNADAATPAALLSR